MKIICPYCGKRLIKRKNVYFCLKCGEVGKIEKGLHYIHRTDQTWDKCEKEKNGWINISKELGLYLDNNDHFYIPDGNDNVKDFYSEVKKVIDKLLEIENFKNKKCVDLGAGIGWVECYVLKRINANIIAIECNDDECIGLGRSIKLKEFHHCDFTSIVADMHNIPIKDKSVDIVFMVDALHHFTDLNKVLTEAHRILKPHGHFWAVNEPFRPEDITDELEFIKNNTPRENKHGIIERRPTISEYMKAGEKLNLRVMNGELDFHSPGLILYGEK